MTDLSNKINSCPCDVHTNEINSHKEDIKSQNESKSILREEMASIKTSITFMTKSIDALTQRLENKGGIISDPFTQRQSPIQITPKGNDVVEKLGLYDMVDSNWDRINYLMDENAISKNPYDIQQFLIEHTTVFPEKFINNTDLEKIKVEAYKEGLNLMSYMTVIAVIIRDRYFDEHNIDLGEVDKHDPNIK